MPYIAQHERDEAEAEGPSSPGQLNYLITKMVDSYLDDGVQLRYRDINEAIGVLECVKLELYRRIAVPYEGAKLQENGDVYSEGNQP